MGSSLNGQQIKNTYPALLKFSSNGSMPASVPMIITDGIGNDSPLAIAQEKINTLYSGTNVGLDLSFTNNIFTIGDYDSTSTNTYLRVNVNGGQIITGSNGGYRGLNLDSYNDSYQFGDVGSVTNGNLFVVDNGLSIIKTMKSGADKGLKLNFSNKVYSLGDFNAVDNGTSIIVNDTSESVTITANVTMSLQGTAITDPIPPASPTPVNYLILTVNGLQYKVPLLNL